MSGQNDKLASGGESATYTMPQVSQEKWDAIWDEEEETTEEDNSEWTILPSFVVKNVGK
jgi:hypothetical protein